MSEGWTTIAIRRETARMLDKLKKDFDVKGKNDVIERLIEFYLGKTMREERDGRE